VVDHATDDVYLVAMHRRGDSGGVAAADEWLTSTQTALHDLKGQGGVSQPASALTSPWEGAAVPVATQDPSDSETDSAGVFDSQQLSDFRTYSFGFARMTGALGQSYSTSSPKHMQHHPPPPLPFSIACSPFGRQRREWFC